MTAKQLRRRYSDRILAMEVYENELFVDLRTGWTLDNVTCFGGTLPEVAQDLARCQQTGWDSSTGRVAI